MMPCRAGLCSLAIDLLEFFCCRYFKHDVKEDFTNGGRFYGKFTRGDG